MLVFSLGWWSTRIPTGVLEPHGTWEHSRVTLLFTDGAITLYGLPSQTVWLRIMNLTLRSRNPDWPKSIGLDCTRFARRYSGYLLLDFFSPAGTKMFQFPASASHNYFTHHGIIRFYSYWISPFGYARVNALLAAHRALSWPKPSFIASMSQGIHLVP